MTDTAPSGWHLDKRVSISIIVALLLQTGGLIVWASKIDSRVAVLEKTDAMALLERDANRAMNVGQENRITRLETRDETVEKALASIDSKLDRLVDTIINKRADNLLDRRPP